MPEQTPKTLNHFLFLRFTAPFYALENAEKKKSTEDLLGTLKKAQFNVSIYQVYPASVDADIVLWTAAEAEEPSQAHDFFTRSAELINPYRHLIQPVHTLWGFTKPSQYTKTRSAQEIDPFAKQRKRFLVMYPFAKTGDWYLMSREARQGMMNEHIRIGKEYPQIKQLLLYSFGLQDQEFVVVYETDDLAQFSDLVYALRDTEARRYTALDNPLYTAIYHPPAETLRLWSAS